MFLLVLLLQPFLFSHDVAMANFDIHHKDEKLTLTVSMDKEDFENLYPEKDQAAVDLTQEDEFVQKYLDEHFYLVVNGQKINFILEEVSKDYHHYDMVFLSHEKVEQAIHYIQLKNTCLIEVEDHSNVVNFQINDTNRTFRLHEGRTRIEVEY